MDEVVIAGNMEKHALGVRRMLDALGSDSGWAWYTSPTTHALLCRQVGVGHSDLLFGFPVKLMHTAPLGHASLMPIRLMQAAPDAEEVP